MPRLPKPQVAAIAELSSLQMRPNLTPPDCGSIEMAGGAAEIVKRFGVCPNLISSSSAYNGIGVGFGGLQDDDVASGDGSGSSSSPPLRRDDQSLDPSNSATTCR